jgi:hypothetical protein
VVLLGPRLGLSRPVVRPVCELGCGCLVRLRFALRSLAVWRVCAIAPSFVSGWRAFSSVSLCKTIEIRGPRPRCAASLVPRPRWPELVHRSLLDALAELCGWVYGLFGVSVSCLARIRLRLASALLLSAPMLLGVSLVPLCNTILTFEHRLSDQVDAS